MRRWEYMTTGSLSSDSDLNKRGELGWELISVVVYVKGSTSVMLYYFKRELTDA